MIMHHLHAGSFVSPFLFKYSILLFTTITHSKVKTVNVLQSSFTDMSPPRSSQVY
jgi:hypothetical protein